MTPGDKIVGNLRETHSNSGSVRPSAFDPLSVINTF